MKNNDTRMNELLNLFNKNFNDENKYLFSSPGRIEIIGNHTDHNNGRVVAAAINLDSLAVASIAKDMKVNFISTNLNQHVTVDLSDLNVRSDEIGQTSSLIRGIASKFVQNGHKIGGFNCVVESEVAIGSGLSSSASIEILVGEIFNYFFNSNIIDPIELAKIGQFAENEYFGKPCGLMDQLAIAYGGIIGIDFNDSANPKVESINFNLSNHNYGFLIVDTGGSHEDLTPDYASVPEDMLAIANYFGKRSLRSVEHKEIISNINELRSKFGDRAILRAFHFMEEDERAASLVPILEQGNIKNFISSIEEAGSSSVKWLQNAYSTNEVTQQGIVLALKLTDQFIKETKVNGAAKVHGGGFAGTILTVIDNNVIDEYKSMMEEVFGEKSVTQVLMRDSGTKFIKKIEN